MERVRREIRAMRRRRAVPVPHREFFRAVMIEETVALACSCPRGVDHWYAEARAGAERGAPLRAPADGRAGDPLDESTAALVPRPTR